MAFSFQGSKDSLVHLIKGYFSTGSYKLAIDRMKQLIKMDQHLNFEERDVLFNIYLGVKNSLYNNYQMLSVANLNEKTRIDLKEETKLLVYGHMNEALELVNSCWIEKDQNRKAILDYKYFRGLLHYCKCTVSQHNQRQYESERETALEYFEEILQTPDDVLEAAHPTRLRAASHKALLLPNLNEKILKSAMAYVKGKQGLDGLNKELKGYAKRDLDRLWNDVEFYKAQKKDKAL